MRLLAGTLGRRCVSVLAAALLTASVLGCGGSDARHFPVQRVVAPPLRATGGAPAHVAVIVMENEEYGDVIGSQATPYINGLARRYGLATEMFAIAHPSLPNYLALTGGTTAGITDDCTDCQVRGAGLAGQLAAAGISWRAYMEDLPHPCFLGAGAGDYAKKHDPWTYYRGVSGSPGQCRRIVPLTELAPDERAGSLPRFPWITPNLCHDMHDCDTATGDRFLARLVPALLGALGPRGLLFLTFDEGSSDDGCCRMAAGGHVATIVAGGLARAGARMTGPADHYSTLQAIEDLFGLARLRGAACACTPSLDPLIRKR